MAVVHCGGGCPTDPRRVLGQRSTIRDLRCGACVVLDSGILLGVLLLCETSPILLLAFSFFFIRAHSQYSPMHPYLRAFIY